jgi:hypothetical protein
MLDWLEVEPAWINDSAGALLDQADGLDPLGQWSELVRESDPDRWELLQGEARSAVDLRAGAEVLLRYYDRLAQGRIAPKIKPPSGRWRAQFTSRLKPQGGLDEVLTNFGLSHTRNWFSSSRGRPSFPLSRLMEFFGIRKDRDFIAIENAQGVGRDISTLIAYAVVRRATPLGRRPRHTPARALSSRLRFAHWKPVLRGPIESGQYTSADYTQELNDHGACASCSRLPF